MKNSRLYIITLLITILTYGCLSYSEITITGEAEQTKDGFHVGDYILTYEEIRKYNGQYMKYDYKWLQLKIVGKVRVYETESKSKNGEIMQAREGEINYITSIKSIEIMEWK